MNQSHFLAVGKLMTNRGVGIGPRIPVADHISHISLFGRSSSIATSTGILLLDICNACVAFDLLLKLRSSDSLLFVIIVTALNI
ncbi:MAG TPA: hypothetical protein VE548_06850 [Nitrososphaeraceae archaeon]|nr:hypothetical protein [Nitrososphaeraceae archaeon]